MSESNIYYSQRVQSLKRLYDKIKDICSRHIAIASYRTGDVQKFISDDTNFPLAYLETISDLSEDEGKHSETYSIALNILDIQDEASSEADICLIHDKCKQILDEIKGYMEQKQVFGTKNVSTGQYLIFNDFDDARLVRVRGEFRLTVEKLVTTKPDFSVIFREA